MDWTMGNGERNSDRRLLRSKKRGQKGPTKKIEWCEYAPTECTCKGKCNKGG